MTPNVILDDEFAATFADLSKEREQLRREILRDGVVRVPLTVWRDGGRLVLLDGYTRYQAAKEGNLPFEVVEVKLKDRNAALAYRVMVQFGRRNLTSLAQAYHRGQLYALAGGRQGARTDLPAGVSELQFTAKGIAHRLGVAPRTINRDAALYAAVERLAADDQFGPGYKACLLTERTDLGRKGIIKLAGMKPADRKPCLAELERKRAEAKLRRKAGRNRPKDDDAAPGPVVFPSPCGDQVSDPRLTAPGPIAVPNDEAATGLPPGIDLRSADNRTAAWPADLDHLFTDPPYKDMDAYAWLGRMAAEKLRPGRLALVYASPFHLPEVVARLTAGGLTYLTTFAITYRLANGMKPLHGFIANNFRPVVVLSRGRVQSPGRLVHAAQVLEPAAKPLHPWQQDVGPAVEWIERLTKPGDLIADPYTGSGTTAEAVMRVGGGRRFLGTELDPKTHRAAVGRLAAFRTDVREGGAA